MEKSVVICGYKRTPFHFAGKGALTRIRPDDMAAEVVKSILLENKINPSDIEDVLVGCAFPEGEQGFNLGRIVSQIAGLPITTGGATINRFCGSSMTTTHIAAGFVHLGAGDVFISAGVESMSRIPMGGFNPMPNPKLWAAYPQAYMSMGETAENLAKKYKISREEQDAFALLSQQKAGHAHVQGRFIDEIVPLGDVAEDGTLRLNTTLEALSALKPSFDENGTVTAGTASPVTDGAAALLIASEDYADKNGLQKLARVRSVAVAGCGADVMGIGPVPATKKALARAGLTMADIDLVELNEAFAVQVLAVIRELEIDPQKLNIDGGAIALGHPLGASGARITGKLATLLKREKKKYGLATMCIGGGQGTAIVLETLA